jgi:nucleoside-diphosphate-sugar epimerase
MNRVLVTGARGFIGRHCLAALQGRAGEIHAVSSRPPGDGEEVHWHQADLLDRDSVDALVERVRPSHLLHLAWFSGHRAIYSAPENNHWVKASLGLLASFESGGGQRAVLAGSCAEYDWSEGICSEFGTALKPASVYGAAKVALFRSVEELAARTGLSTAWARIFFLYGPGEPEGRLLASVIRSLLLEQPALCTDGEQLRDYLYVGDVADALVALLGSHVTGPVNIGSGDAVALKELVTAAARKLDREHLVRLGAIQAPDGEAERVQAEIGRLVGEVTWHLRYGLDEGLDRTIEYWRAKLRQGASPSATLAEL